MILRQYAIEGLSQIAFVVQTSLALVTGSMIVMWLSEIITEKGIVFLLRELRNKFVPGP